MISIIRSAQFLFVALGTILSTEADSTPAPARSMVDASTIVGCPSGNRPIPSGGMERPFLGDQVHSIAINRAGILAAVSAPDGHLHLIDIKQRLLICDLGEGLFAEWSPNGKRLAFLSSRAGDLQIYIWELGHALRQVGKWPGGIDPDPNVRMGGYLRDTFKLSWSPDNQRIAFATRRTILPPPPLADGPLILTKSARNEDVYAGVYALAGLGPSVMEWRNGREILPRRIPAGSHLSSQIVVADIRDDSLRWLTQSNGNTYSPSWSIDGTAVFAVNLVGGEGQSMEDALMASRPSSRIVKLDAKDGRVEAMAEIPGAVRNLKLSSDGSRLAYLVSPDFGSPPELKLTSTELSHPAQTLPSSGLVVDFEWSPSGRSVFASTEDGIAVVGRRLRMRKVVNSRTFLDAWQPVNDQSVATWNGFDVSTYVTAKVAAVQRLYRNENASGWGMTETVHWKSSDGAALTGTILFPPHYLPGRRYPIVVDAYPFSGERGSWKGAQWLAQAGYVVFASGGRAPHAWMNDATLGPSSKGAKGWDLAVDDVQTGVDLLISRGIADSTRMCISGISNGGGVASYLITKSHRFKCAVITAPAMTDWVGKAIRNVGGREKVNSFSGMAGTFYDNLDEFIEMSSVFQAKNVKTPVLIAVGDLDGEILLSSINLFISLQSAGNEVELLRYPNQGHIFDERSEIDYRARQLNFLDRHIGH